MLLHELVGVGAAEHHLNRQALQAADARAAIAVPEAGDEEDNNVRGVERRGDLPAVECVAAFSLKEGPSSRPTLAAIATVQAAMASESPASR